MQLCKHVHTIDAPLVHTSLSPQDTRTEYIYTIDPTCAELNSNMEVCFSKQRREREIFLAVLVDEDLAG
jgi:hypothetical protein